MLSPHNHYCPPIKTKSGGHGGSVVGEGDTIVWVLGCPDEKIEWGMGYFTPNHRCCLHAIGITHSVKPRVGDVGGVWWVKGIWWFGYWDAEMERLSREWGLSPQVANIVSTQSVSPTH